ncbi:hypothetical protein RI129_011275 [Pyrocoelia pectoralis]|uniref:Peptidase S1 domain-containing protein n=1 Tax=Pyrocoelia pectoralis TaxID=417401 RepID=A0AAN7V5Z8_9COLE
MLKEKIFSCPDPPKSLPALRRKIVSFFRTLKQPIFQNMFQNLRNGVKVGTILVNEGGDVYEVSEARVHPEYTNYAQNDIAIVKLKSPISFNEKVQPIALETEYVDADVKCVLTGWGSLQFPGTESNELQQLNLKTVTNTECSTILTDNIDETKICTFTKAGEGSCVGDSGGPLVADKQIGIVSYGIPCGIGYPDVFTRVSAYKDWIEQNRH